MKPGIIKLVLKRLIVPLLLIVIIGPLLGANFLVSAQEGEGASLSLRPSSGTFIVNNTFDVSITLNTNGRSVNAVDALITFPADKLQVVSPSLGKSIVGIWATPPTFNNQDGTLRFQGGIPSPGINTSSGVISTITFRVKSIGTATVNFSDTSKVFLNDGLGTDILTNTSGGIYNLILPPPAGPTVISPTHPDQTTWNTNTTVVLEWTAEAGVTGYSYMLNGEPVDTPDDVSEGSNTGVAYKNLQDGIQYFHIKSIKNGSWGGVTHYAVKIDGTPPVEFKINVSPGTRTTSRLPIIEFFTTDQLSGLDHYELKVISLDLDNIQPGGGTENFFIEAQGRYVPPKELTLGSYDLIVRAYDRAGNVREVIQSITIANPFFDTNESGLIVAGKFVIPWIVLFIIGILIMLTLMYTLWIASRMHKNVKIRELEGALSDPTIQERLKYLKEKQGVYGKTAGATKHLMIFLVAGSILYSALFLSSTRAAEFAQLVPPTITTIARDITNDQLFYIGGTTEITGVEVIIYLQNVQDNQVLSSTVTSDDKGKWFYTHREPLMSGKYLLWTQLKLDKELSPPGPQNEITVSRTAFQIGASRLSYETLYLLLAIILFLIVLILGSLNFYHYYRARGKHGRLVKEITEAEDAIRKGFATLQHDITQELAIIHQARLSKSLSREGEEKEKQLIKDLREVAEYVKKEVSDIEKTA